ncbi:MAG: WD40 repeat domain-containing protein, partial [Polyangia bacterium]
EVEEDAQSRAFLVNRQRKLREAVSGQKQRPARQYSARWLIDRHTPELAMPLDCPATLRENQDRWRRDWQRSGELSIPEGALSVPVAQAEKARAYNQRLCAGRLGDFWSDGRSLTEVIVDDLKAAILERYPERKELPEQDDLSREIDRHEDFVRTAADVFIERPGDFADLDAYAVGDSQKLFVLVAKAGLGKSTLLANWVARWRSRDGKPADETMHARFVGVGERSNNVDSLLRSILEELRRAGKLTSEIPDNPNVLRSKLPELLGECRKKGRTVIVIDALNQLQSGLSDLDWIARTLPENVKLVVSFKLGDAAGDALAAQLRADELVTLSEVRPFAALEERRQLVRQFLRQFLKELDEQHLEALIRADGADNPLFLKVALTELRVFGAFGQLGEVIRRQFGTAPQSAFEAVLRRLESDPSYAAVSSPQAVPLLFGLLAHSRGGLPTDLLARMFLAELGLGEARLADMEATIQLFLRQVRPFLARREGRVDFFYESFDLAARDRYTGEGAGQRSAAAWHGQLARACDAWRTLTGASRRYGLQNLAQHHVAAGQANQSAEALTDFGYHYERLKTLGREDVVNVTADFALVDGVAGLAPTVREARGEPPSSARRAPSREGMARSSESSAAGVAGGVPKSPQGESLPGFPYQRMVVWKAFHAENAHLLRRQDVVPEISLLQLAVAHADTSPVTGSAERWLEDLGSEALWLHSLSRPHERERSACLRTLEGHTGWVTAVAALPDGKRALSGSEDKTLRLWDLETGQCLRTLDGHTASVTAVAVSPGKHALSGGKDNTFKLWDLETGQCLRTMEGHTDVVLAVAPLPDGKRAISGSWDKTLKLWDLETGQCLRTLEGHTGWVKAVAALPDGKSAISGSGDKTLKLWDLETGQCLRTLEGHTNYVEAIAPSSDGKRVLSGSEDRTIKLWDIETGQCLRTLQGHHAGHVTAVVLLPDGNRALEAAEAQGHDNTLKLWDLETGQCLGALEGHTSDVLAIAPLPDGKRALSGGYDRTLKLWDLEAEQSLRIPVVHAWPAVAAVALLPDGKRVLSCSEENAIKLWDPETGQCLRTIAGHAMVAGAVVPLPDGKHALSGSRDKTLKLWDIETGQCLRTFEGHTNVVMAVAALADGKRVLSGSWDKTLKLWDIETGQCLRTLQGHTDCVNALAALPDGKRAMSGSRDKTLKLWDIETGQCLRTLQGHTDYVNALAALPDGKRALSGAGGWQETDRTLKLWDLETGQCLRTFEGHTHMVEAIALLPDGKCVVSGSCDKALKLWDIETGICLATWQAAEDVRCCAAVRGVIVAGTSSGEVLFLKLMPPGRITPVTIAATWHPSRPILAVARANGTILVQTWHPESQYLEEMVSAVGPSVASPIEWSRDGRRIVYVSRDNTEHILDAATLQPASASGDWAPSSLNSPDGRWRAVIEAGQLRIVPAREA